MKPGSVIMTVARFPNGVIPGTEATGYRAVYTGALSFWPEDSHATSAILGFVNWIREELDPNGNPYLIVYIGTGRNKDGLLEHALIRISDPEVMAYCKRQFADLVRIRVKAAFRCYQKDTNPDFYVSDYLVITEKTERF